MQSKQPDLCRVLRQCRYEHNLIKGVNCTKDECKELSELIESKQSLPDDIVQGRLDDEFLRINMNEVTENEVFEYLMFKQLNTLISIKACLIFFVILTILGFLGILMLLSAA